MPAQTVIRSVITGIVRKVMTRKAVQVAAETTVDTAARKVDGEKVAKFTKATGKAVRGTLRRSVKLVDTTLDNGCKLVSGVLHGVVDIITFDDHDKNSDV